jgi:hypothetical protein
MLVRRQVWISRTALLEINFFAQQEDYSIYFFHVWSQNNFAIFFRGRHICKEIIYRVHQENKWNTFSCRLSDMRREVVDIDGSDVESFLFDCRCGGLFLLTVDTVEETSLRNVESWNVECETCSLLLRVVNKWNYNSQSKTFLRTNTASVISFKILEFVERWQCTVSAS